TRVNHLLNSKRRHRGIRTRVGSSKIPMAIPSRFPMTAGRSSLMTRSFAAQLLDSEPRTRATMNRSMVFFSLWLLVLTPLVFPIDPLPSAERVTIASVSPGLFEFPLVVASKKGFFKEENLEVVKVQMQPQISVMALVAGDVDY